MTFRLWFSGRSHIRTRIQLQEDLDADILGGFDNGLTCLQTKRDEGYIRADALGLPLIFNALLKRAGVNSRLAEVIHACLISVAGQIVVAIVVGLACP